MKFKVFRVNFVYKQSSEMRYNRLCDFHHPERKHYAWFICDTKISKLYLYLVFQNQCCYAIGNADFSMRTLKSKLSYFKVTNKPSHGLTNGVGKTIPAKTTAVADSHKKKFGGI